MSGMRIVVILSMAALLVAGCGAGSTPTALPTVVLDTSAGASGGVVTASGVIVPTRHADLSFPLTGVVRQVEAEVGDKVSAGQLLIQLDASVWEAEARVAQADLDAEQADYRYQVRSGTDQEHLDSALADIDRAEAQLAIKNAVVSQAALVAPFAGTVASIEISPAETVVPGQVVLTLGDLTKFQVETTDLSERDAPRVRIGQQAQVDVPALGQQVQGKVIDVARVASTIGGDVVYKVTISIDAQPAGLMWGMTSTVTIETGE